MAAQPVHVGGHWQIVNVGWGGPNIGAIALDFSMNARGFPTFTISDFPFSSGSYNLFQDSIKVADGISNPGVVNPVSKEMRKHLYAWQFTPTKVGPNSDFVCSGAALVFLNLGKVIFDAVQSDPGRKDVTLCIVHTPAGGVDSHTSVSYWLWDNSFASSFEEALLTPLTTGDPFSPFPPTDPRSVMTLPRAFSSAADRAPYLALGISTWFSAETSETTTMNNHLNWSLAAFAFQRKTSFSEGGGATTDVEHSELATQGREILKSFAGAGANQGSNPSLAAQSVRIKLTFKGLQLEALPA